MMKRPRRLSLRTRAAILTALLLVSSFMVLIVGQWFLVRHLLGNELALVTTITEYNPTTNQIEITGPFEVVSTAAPLAQPPNLATQISQGVLNQLVHWSIGAIIVATALSTAAAWWLAKRSSEAFERQSRFIAGASHELRTPATTARTVLEIPLQQGRFPADLEPAVNSALAANQKSEQLIASLLQLTEAGKLPKNSPKDNIDVAALTKAQIAERQHIAAQRGIHIETNLTPAITYTDKGLLSLAIGNLLDNAIKHNRPNGTIIVQTGTTSKNAYIKISNDGADLTTTNLNQLKEPFHRGANSRLNSEGQGLGLSLADTAITTLKGTLTLSPNPNQNGGLTALVSLPQNAKTVV